MAQSLISIRMDEKLKKDFDMICNELGMNMSTAVTIFAKKVVRECGIPFEVSTGRAATLAAMAEAEEMREHPERYQRYSSFDDLLNEVSEDA